MTTDTWTGDGQPTPARKLADRLTPVVTLRWATGGDLPAVAALMSLSGVATLDPELATALANGVVGNAHRAALAARGRENGAHTFLHAIAEQAAVKDLRQAYLAAAVVLVADVADRQCVGTVVALPPPRVAAQFVDAIGAGDGSRQANTMLLTGAIGLAKVHALAVADGARRDGIGGALINRVTELYFHNGFHCVYGQMPDQPGLAEFYRRHGFDVHEPGAGLDLWRIFGVPGGLVPAPNEQIFARWRTTQT